MASPLLSLSFNFPPFHILSLLFLLFAVFPLLMLFSFTVYFVSFSAFSFLILSIKLPCTYTPLLPFTFISLTSLFSFPVLRLFYSHFLSILLISFLVYLSFPSLVSLFSFPPLSFIPLSLPFLSSHMSFPFLSSLSFSYHFAHFRPSYSLLSLCPSFLSLPSPLYSFPPLPVHSVIYSRLQYTL